MTPTNVASPQAARRRGCVGGALLQSRGRPGGGGLGGEGLGLHRAAVWLARLAARAFSKASGVRTAVSAPRMLAVQIDVEGGRVGHIDGGGDARRRALGLAGRQLTREQHAAVAQPDDQGRPTFWPEARPGPRTPPRRRSRPWA